MTDTYYTGDAIENEVDTGRDAAGYVTDPDLLDSLHGQAQQEPPADEGYVTDPDLLKSLHGRPAGDEGYVTDPDLLKSLGSVPAPPAEGGPMTLAREFLHEAPAVVVGTGAGLLTGAAGGARFGLPGALVAGGIGAVAGGMAGEAAKSKVLESIGFDDAALRAANAEAHPWAAATGSAAANILGFGPGLAGRGIQAATRAVGGVLSGALATGQKLYEGKRPEETNWQFLQRAAPDVLTHTAAGVALPNPYRWGQQIEQAGASLGARIPGQWGRPGAAAPPPSPSPPPPAGPAQPGLPFGEEGARATGGTRTPQQPYLPLREPYRPETQFELPIRTPRGEQTDLPLRGQFGPTAEQFAGMAEQARTAPAGAPVRPSLGREAAPESPAALANIPKGGQLPPRVPPTEAEARAARAPYDTAMADLFQTAADRARSEGRGRFGGVGAVPVESYPGRVTPAPPGDAPPPRGGPGGGPGPAAAGGVAEAKPPPPRGRRGPENWAKKQEPAAPGAGVNVGQVDPTVAQAIQPPAPPAPPAPLAPPATAPRRPPAPAPKLPAPAPAAPPAAAPRRPPAPPSAAPRRLPTPAPAVVPASRRAGEFHVESSPFGPGHVLKRGNQIVSQHPNLGQALVALNKAAKGAEAAPTPAAARRPVAPVARTEPAPAPSTPPTATQPTVGATTRARLVRRGFNNDEIDRMTSSEVRRILTNEKFATQALQIARARREPLPLGPAPAAAARRPTNAAFQARQAAPAAPSVRPVEPPTVPTAKAAPKEIPGSSAAIDRFLDVIESHKTPEEKASGKGASREELRRMVRETIETIMGEKALPPKAVPKETPEKTTAIDRFIDSLEKYKTPEEKASGKGAPREELQRMIRENILGEKPAAPKPSRAEAAAQLVQKATEKRAVGKELTTKEERAMLEASRQRRQIAREEAISGTPEAAPAAPKQEGVAQDRLDNLFAGSPHKDMIPPKQRYAYDEGARDAFADRPSVPKPETAKYHGGIYDRGYSDARQQMTREAAGYTIPRGPLAREVAPQHLPWYERGLHGEPRGGNQAEQAAWDRGSMDRAVYLRRQEQPTKPAPVEAAPPKPTESPEKTMLAALEKALFGKAEEPPAPAKATPKETPEKAAAIDRFLDVIESHKTPEEKASGKGASREELRRMVRENLLGEKPESKALRAGVLERGREGRPLRTAPLPLGSEQAILEAGARRMEGRGLYPDVDFYHGTNKNFREFKDQPGKEKGAFFFTQSPRAASNYATSMGDLGANVRPARLDIRNPKYVTNREYEQYASMTPEMVKALKAEGYDSVVLLRSNAFHRPGPGDKAGDIAEVAVFSSGQIKPKYSDRNSQAMARRGEPAERQPPGAPARVRTHDGAVFTGKDEATAYANAARAGYRPNQILNAQGHPYTTPPTRPPAGPPPAGPPPAGPPPAGPPAGGQPPPYATPMSLKPATAMDLQTGIIAGLRRMFVPRTSPSAHMTAGMIRSERGELHQKQQEAMSRFFNKGFFQPTMQLLNKFTPNDFRQFMQAYESGKIGTMPAAWQPIALKFKQGFKDFEDALRAMPSKQQFDALQDYFSHMWENKDQARQFLTGWYSAGGSGSLRQRSFPTFEDGINAELVPKFVNPMDYFARYSTSISDYISSRNVISALEREGVVGHFGPQVVGASGAPMPHVRGAPPIGYAKIEAPWASRNGRDAYAPRDIADTLNNFYSAGLRRNESARDLVDFMQQTKNMWTGLELGLSAYHAFTEIHESIASGLARAVMHMGSGDIVGAAKQLAGVPFEPVTSAVKGHSILQLYRGQRAPRNAMEALLKDALTHANVRPGDMAATGEYNMASHGAFIDSIRQGSLTNELKADWKNMTTGTPLARLGSALAFVPQQVGRLMQTIAYPLFQGYIPRIKMGALAKDIESFLHLNPSATKAQLHEFAQKAADSIDNRMGEMVKENLIMNKVVKDMGYLGLRSFAWTLGGPIREIGGGAASLARGLAQGQNRLDARSPNFDPRAAYAIAFPASVAGIAALYNLARTGELPDDWRGYVTPYTSAKEGLAGKVKSVGKTVREMVLLPGYHKDFIGYYFHPGQELWAKVAAPWQALYEQVANTKWPYEGTQIVPPRATMKEQLQYRAGHLGERLSPIGIKTMPGPVLESIGLPKEWGTAPKPGTAITPLESALGFRAAGAHMLNPEGLERFLTNKQQREFEHQQRTENRSRVERGQPAIPLRRLPRPEQRVE